jgi:hypothetical protein
LSAPNCRMAAIKRPFNSWCQQEPIRPSKRIVNHEISTCMHLDLSRFLDPSVISEQGELALVPRLGYFSSTSMTSCCPFLKEIRFWSVHKSQHGVVKENVILLGYVQVILERKSLLSSALNFSVVP